MIWSMPRPNVGSLIHGGYTAWQICQFKEFLMHKWTILLNESSFETFLYTQMKWEEKAQNEVAVELSDK